MIIIIIIIIVIIIEKNRILIHTHFKNICREIDKAEYKINSMSEMRTKVTYELILFS